MKFLSRPQNLFEGSEKERFIRAINHCHGSISHSRRGRRDICPNVEKPNGKKSEVRGLVTSDEVKNMYISFLGARMLSADMRTNA